MIGFYNVLKQPGVSSTFVVSKIKQKTKAKVGHLGTLDPLAAGVLTIAVGKATKFFDYFLEKDKEYFALAKMGVLTDTLDSEGKVLERNNIVTKIKDIEGVLSQYIGDIDQMPPLYSAKSVNGVRAYDAARNGKNIELSTKKVHIYDIKVQKTSKTNLFRLKIHCSAGTYVRSVVRDVAKSAGTVATTVSILRTRSGAFDIKDAVTLEEILNDPHAHLIKINDILKLPVLDIDESNKKDLASGKEISCEWLDGNYLAMYNGKEFATVVVKDRKAKNDIYLYEEDNNG